MFRYKQIHTSTVTLAIAAMLCCMVSKADSNSQKAVYAIVNWRTAIYETPDAKEECPQGFAPDEFELWKKTISKEQLDKATSGGTVGKQDIRPLYYGRGEGGKDICYNPTSIEVPEMPIAQSKHGFGMNLDGSESSEATAKTCKHPNLISPSGERGIDNQWGRVVGCVQGWRTGGYIDDNPNGELRDGRRALLIEIDGITNWNDSPSVTVTFHQAIDTLTKDNVGGSEILPFASFRVADNFRYVAKGNIKDGVLSTEPMDIHFPFYANLMHSDRYLREMRLRVKLSANEPVSGLVAGYYDLDSLWQFVTRQSYLGVTSNFSCPALYKAMTRAADGHRNDGGDCTSISSAFEIKAVPAFIVPDPKSK